MEQWISECVCEGLLKKLDWILDSSLVVLLCALIFAWRLHQSQANRRKWTAQTKRSRNCVKKCTISVAMYMYISCKKWREILILAFSCLTATQTRIAIAKSQNAINNGKSKFQANTPPMDTDSVFIKIVKIANSIKRHLFEFNWIWMLVYIGPPHAIYTA